LPRCGLLIRSRHAALLYSITSSAATNSVRGKIWSVASPAGRWDSRL
jgi:hypothetical protein